MDTQIKLDVAHEKINELSKDIHELIHLLLPILNTKPRAIGVQSMLELMCMNVNLEKEEFLNFVSVTWDCFKDVEKIRKEEIEKTKQSMGCGTQCGCDKE